MPCDREKSLIANGLVVSKPNCYLTGLTRSFCVRQSKKRLAWDGASPSPLSHQDAGSLYSWWFYMLVLSRKKIESFVLPDGTEFRLVETRGDKVPVGLVPPPPPAVTCFISYSQKDEAFARKLFARLEREQVPAWFAPEHMKGGQKISDQLTSAIRESDKILFVLSESSMRSDWVQSELRWARDIERQQGRQKLFPLRVVDMETVKEWRCFDADLGKDLAVDLREYYIPDFTGWDQDGEFEAAFSRLVRDLLPTQKSKQEVPIYRQESKQEPLYRLVSKREVPIYRQELFPLKGV
jgi:hypothetical protein